MPMFFTHRQPILLMKHEISFYSHFHYEAELVYCIEGAYRVISRGVTYDLKAGDIWFGFPFEEHSYETIGDNVTMIAIFSPEDIGAYGSILRDRRPEYPVVDASCLSPGFGEGLIRIAQLWMAMLIHENDVFQSRDGWIQDERYLSREVSRETIIAYLSAAVGELLGTMKLGCFETVGVGNIQRIIEYCRENLADPELSMNSLSRAVGLSRSQISRIMSQTMKTNFPRFIHSLRINQARNLLKYSDETITNIALDCGFMSQCSFNRVFREMVKMTPSEYRNTARKRSRSDFTEL